jgi:hypothetical protein
MPKRWNRPDNNTDPDALAARLPDDLRSFDGLDTVGDYRTRWTAVADWLNTQVPGHAEGLVHPVMNAADLGVVEFYKLKLTQKAPL